MSAQYDDGRGLTGRQRDSFLRAQMGRYISYRMPEPAKLTLSGISLGSRDQAYALAIRLMQEADRLWPRDAN